MEVEELAAGEQIEVDHEDLRAWSRTVAEGGHDLGDAARDLDGGVAASELGLDPARVVGGSDVHDRVDHGQLDHLRDLAAGASAGHDAGMSHDPGHALTWF